MIDGYYVTLGSSADVYEVGARAAENIYLDSVIIFLYVSCHLLGAILTRSSCLIVFQNIVPISLYITIEVVKTVSPPPSTPDIANPRSKHSSSSKIVKCITLSVSRKLVKRPTC